MLWGGPQFQEAGFSSNLCGDLSLVILIVLETVIENLSLSECIIVNVPTAPQNLSTDI